MTDDQIFDEARHLSIMGVKLRHLIASARQCVHVQGHVVEVGSYRGGSGLALCRVFDEKKVFMVDTFTGIPEDDAHEAGHKRGDFGDTSAGAVETMLYDKQITNGIVFPADIRARRVQTFFYGMQIAFVHLDADIEQSTNSALDLLVNRLMPGGGIFFDDYGSQRCPGVKPAVDELMRSGRFEMSHATGTVFLKLNDPRRLP